MHIAVIAADGRLGSLFVEEALKAGHSIRAGIRGENHFAAHPQLEVKQCDATQPQQLRELMKDQDSVVSALGHVKGSKDDVQTVATKAILQVMSELGIKRFVDVTGTGVRFAGDRIGPVDILLNVAVEIIDPARINDGREHIKVLQASDAEWTSIRVLKLQNVEPQAFELKLNGPTKWYVGRREVARAMLEVLENHSFLQQAPIIAKPTKR